MKLLKKTVIVFTCLIITGCGDSDCVNDFGPQAGQCINYPDATSCSQVSPYHHSCTP